jgi:hypothetical protein
MSYELTLTRTTRGMVEETPKELLAELTGLNPSCSQKKEQEVHDRLATV